MMCCGLFPSAFVSRETKDFVGQLNSMKCKLKFGRQRIRGQRRHFWSLIRCLCSREQLQFIPEMNPSPKSPETRGSSRSVCSSRVSEVEKKLDIGNIEEAELSLRESSSLNYEEARALLGRIEYQKGNLEAALHVFEGIDIAAASSKMKHALSRKGERKRRQSNNYAIAAPPMSIPTVSLLLEATFLKAKSLQHLSRFKEAAQCCKSILDIVEGSLPEGLPENFGADCKLPETLNKAVELLPELWKLADCPKETILSYRRALLHQWNLNPGTTARIQKNFAIFLLYTGGEACPPDLRVQMDGSFVPKNNLEEAILLLMILFRKNILKRIDWDPTILDHLSFALSISGDLKALASQLEELLPRTIPRGERYHILALCYHGVDEDIVALNLLRKLLSNFEDPNCVPALLMASKICGQNHTLADEGVSFGRRALSNLEGECNELEGTASFVLGIALSAHSKLAVSESERVARQSEAVQALETAKEITQMKDLNILYQLCLENAEQRKLDVALYFAKSLLKLEGGCNTRGWLLLSRVLSAQKCFRDAETVIYAALDQTSKWDQGELLQTKAKLQIAQGQLTGAIQTYMELLALLQLQNKYRGSVKKSHKGSADTLRAFELQIWHDLADLYISLSRWNDAEICLSKSKAICFHSAARYHATGVLYERRGLLKHALIAFGNALHIDPDHVPTLVSAAKLCRRMGGQSTPIARSFVQNALRVDRTNQSAWYILGQICKAEGTPSSLQEAAECFESAAFLESSAPVEPFR